MMTLIYYISIYLMIGTVLQIIYDWIERNMTDNISYPKLNDQDRLVSIFIWPLGLLVFLDSFWKAYNKNDDDD